MPGDPDILLLVRPQALLHPGAGRELDRSDRLQLPELLQSDGISQGHVRLSGKHIQGQTVQMLQLQGHLVHQDDVDRCAEAAGRLNCQ